MAVVIAATSACNPYAVTSEEEQLTVRLTDLQAPGFYGLTLDTPILRGSRTASDWGPEDLDINTDISTVDQCFRVTTEPDVGTLGEELRFDEVGPVVWTFVPIACSGIQPGVHDEDRLELEVVAASEVTVRRHFWAVDSARDLLAERDDLSVTGERSELADTLSPREAPLRVIAGGQTRLEAELRDADGRYVVMGEGLGGLQLDGLPFEPEGPLGGVFTAPDEPGATGRLTFESFELQADLGEVRVVSPDDIDDLGIIGLESARSDGDRTVQAVLAVPTNAEGDRLFGAPISWTVRVGASLPLNDPERSDNDGPLLDLDPTRCLPPTERVGTHVSVLRAETFDHVEEIRLTWIVEEEDLRASELEADPEWVRPPECGDAVDDEARTGGCACTSSPSPTGWLAGLGLLGGALVRRRRLYGPL